MKTLPDRIRIIYLRIMPVIIQRSLNLPAIAIALLFWGSFFSAPCQTKNRMKEPMRTNYSNPYNYGTGSNLYLGFYQNWLSPVNGTNRCPMYPSCSQYSKVLFQSRPFHKAYIGTFERLLQCGRELYLYETIKVNGSIRWYDPPDVALSSELYNYNNTDFNVVQNYPNKGGYRALSTLALEEKADTIESFADFLFKNGEYYRALTEYRRLQYQSTDPVRRLYYLHKIGLCYYFGGDYDGFITYMDRNRTLFNQDKTAKAELELLLGKTYYHLKEYQKAITILQWSSIDNDNYYYSESQFMLGLSYARIFYWEKAFEHLSSVDSLSQRYDVASEFLQSERLANSLPACQPWLAGSLSAVIPGLGYLYAHRTGTALASFIINSLIFWTGQEAIEHESYGLAATIGFFGIGWYAGNIKGSVDAAKKYNYTVRNRYVDQILGNAKIDIR